MNLIDITSPAGEAFNAFCEDPSALAQWSADSREEFASVARMWLDTPAIAEPSAPEDQALPGLLREFIAECERPR